MGEPKMPEVRMVGATRPGLTFPDSAGDFFDFFTKKIGERFFYHPLTPATISSVTSEALQLLHLANDIYRLGCGHDFWRVDIETIHDQVIIEFRPVSLGDRIIELEEHPQGGWVAKTDQLYVRGDSQIEALAGLGRLMQSRTSRPAAVIDPPIWNPTCTCGTGRGCVIHD